jgi:hypothetical protein
MMSEEKLLMSKDNKKNNELFVYIRIIITVALVMAGCIAGVLTFFGLEIVRSDSIVSVTEVQADYVPRSTIESAYVEKAKVQELYVLKEEMQKILQGHISSETIRKDYVSREQHETVVKENSNLKAELYEIPSPFKPIQRELSYSGKWHDERLGLLIEIQSASGFKGHMNVVFALQLPDSPLHKEYVSEDNGKVPQWRFHKAGREFELSMERVSPPVFIVREI